MLIGRVTLAMATSVAVAAVTMASAPASAQGSLQDQMAVCARISKKSARMECYDSVANAAQNGSSSSASPSGFGSSSIRNPAPAAPPPPPAPPAAAGAGFGSEQVSRPAPPPANIGGDADEVEVAVQSARDNGLRMWQITLADGAIWRMTERASAGFRPPAPNETMTIRKAALGSYLMQVGRQAAVRVNRVR